MLALLVLVHELGHFLTARWLGIAVEEFGIGFPPRAVVLFERAGVKYTLNWLPIGGFVRFGGEGDVLYGAGGSLAAAAPWKKILVLLAGPLMNLLLTYVIYAGLIMANGMPQVVDGVAQVRDGVLITQIIPGTPAERAGFQPNDLLLALDTQAIAEDAGRVRAAAEANTGQAIPALVERNGQQITLDVTPGPWTNPDGGQQFPTGFGFSYSQQPELVSVGFFGALIAGVEQTWNTLVEFVKALGQLFGGLLGFNEPIQGGVTGVVGMARGTGEVIERFGATGFWNWTALISLNLFLFNLLPIPALDGSHILFALIQMVRRGKRIPPEREALVHAVGFALLMGLMVVVTISDVANWIGGGPALGQ
ncbi:MAG: site-2 protease family protein [Roseiflexaceae bacterium]|nr:site-2 protease family protein [Roseiflexaceae bacterium]